MPKTKIKLGSREIEAWYERPALIPEEWVYLVQKLHPVTAIVIWEVLTGNISAETIYLAQSSPDWNRFTVIRTVGEADPVDCEGLASAARNDLEELFIQLVPNYITRRILQ